MPSRPSLCTTFFVHLKLTHLNIDHLFMDVKSSIATVLGLQHISQPLPHKGVLFHFLPQAKVPVLQVALHPVFFADFLPSPEPLPPSSAPSPQAHDSQRPLRHLEAQFQDKEDHQDEDEGDPPSWVLAECAKEATTDVIRRRFKRINSSEEDLPEPPAGDGNKEGAENEK